MVAKTKAFLFLVALLCALGFVRIVRANESEHGLTKLYVDTQIEQLGRELWRNHVGWQIGLSALIVAVSLFLIGRAYQTAGEKPARLVEEKCTGAIATFKSDCDKVFGEHRQRLAEARNIAYEGAIRAVQGASGCMGATTGESLTEQTEETLKRIELAGAELQVRFGDSRDAIAGANKLYELCDQVHIARRTLEAGLKRQELNAEAKDIIRDRLSELEERRAR